MCVRSFGTKNAVSIHRAAIALVEYSQSQMELCLGVLIKQLESWYAATLGAIVAASLSLSFSL
jgi:hypothetical protein